MGYMSHINKFNPRKVENINPFKLKKSTYYVVLVKFNGANSAHRAIFWHSHGGHGVLLNATYEQHYNLYYLSLYKFEVIEEITAMHRQEGEG